MNQFFFVPLRDIFYKIVNFENPLYMKSIMKRYFLLLVLVSVSVASWAIGRGDGSRKEDAKEYSWSTGEIHADGGNVVTWYRIDLTPVMDYENATLAMTLRNTSSQPTSVTVTLYAGDESESRTYTLDAESKLDLKPRNIGSIVHLFSELYLTVKSSQPMSLVPEVIETEDMIESCATAIPFVMGGQSQEAGSDKWYELNLASVRSDASKMLVLTYRNDGSSVAIVRTGLSPECPSSGLTERTMTIAPGAIARDTIARAMLNMLPNFVFLEVESNSDLTISGTMPAKTGTNTSMSGCNSAVPVVLDGWNTIRTGGDKYFKVDAKSLFRHRYQPQIVFDNRTGGSDVNVTVDIFYACSLTPVDFTTHKMTVAAGQMDHMDFAMNMVQLIDTALVDEVYARVRVNGKIEAQLRMRHVREKDECRYAANFDWKQGNFQTDLNTRWYAVDIKDAKRTYSDIEILVVNRGTATAHATAELAFMCPYTDAQSMSRSLTVGDTLRKTIQYGTFAMLGNDTIWVGLTTDQPTWFGAKKHAAAIHEPDDKCLHAVEFDWVNGNSQAAGDTVWYRVAVDTLRRTTNLPQIVITNQGASTLKIFGEMSIDCPDSITNETRTLAIAGGGMYVKQLSRDMANNLDSSIDSIYIRLVGTQNFSFRMGLDMPDQGSACEQAYEYNWVTGIDQIADTAVWYTIDLTQVAGKDLNLKLQNRSKFGGNLQIKVAPTCPCETPQVQTVSLAAGALRTKLIPQSMLSMVGDRIWMCISGNIAFHAEAELVEPEAFEQITACASATNAEYGVDYHQMTDTAWYVFETDTVLRTWMVPQVTVLNGSTAQTVKVEVAFECPVTMAMASRSVVLDADRELSKMVERSMAESMATQHDRIYVRLTGTSDFTFRVDMADPNTGDDCAHAHLIAMDETVVQAAGTTTWYRVEMAQLRQEGAKVEALIGNMDGRRGAASVAFYSACGSDAIQTASVKLGANAVLTKSVSADMASAISGEWLYVQLYTESEDSIRFHLIPAPEIEPITACEDARELVPNTSYTLNPGETVWYMMDLRALRENYSGDGVFTFINLSEEDSSFVSASMVWNCPVTHEMDVRHFRMGPDEDHLQVLSRSALESLSHDTVYLCLSATAMTSFSGRFTRARGGSCENAIPFDWNARNPYYGGEDMWYAVHVDSAALNNHNLILHAENQGAFTISTLAYFHSNCEESFAKAQLNNSVASGEVSSRVVKLDTLQTFGWWPDTTIYLRFFASQNMRLWVDTMPLTYVNELDTICAGGSLSWRGQTLTETGLYRDTVVGAIYTMDLWVAPAIADDTISRVICQGDSIYFGGMWCRETKLYVDSAKSVLGCDSVTVLNLTVVGTTDVSIPYVDCDSVYVDEVARWFYADSAWVDSVVSPEGCVSYRRFAVTVHTSYPRMTERRTICDGEAVTWHGKKYTRGGVYCDSLKSQFGCDSVTYLLLTVNPSYKDTIYRTICQGDTVKLAGEKYFRTGQYTIADNSVEGCDSITILRLTVREKLDVIDTVRFCDSVYVFGRWRKTNFEYTDFDPEDMACGSTVTYRYIRNQSYHFDTVAVSQEGTPFVWRGKGYLTSGTKYDSLKTKAGCDSVYVLHLTMLAGNYSEYTYHACEGDSVVLADAYGVEHAYYRSTVVRDTFPTPAETGGKIVRVTHIVFHPSYHMQEPSIRLREGQTVSWKTYHLGDIKTIRKDTVTGLDTCFTQFRTSTWGCDSTVCVHVTVLPRTYGDEWVDICEGETYEVRYDYASRWYTKRFSEEGTYTITRDNFLGGDSIHTIHITVRPHYMHADTITLALGDSVHYFNPVSSRDTLLYATSAGVTYPVMENMQTVFGCDSTFQLRLVVINPAEGIWNVWGDGDEHVVQKIIYRDQLYMIVDDRRYDAMGRRIE